jgi:DNA helicase II / ATP-dependent DNA helicase PcrA
MDLSRLNKEQKEAVCFGEGPLLVVAGAGTGKTTVLTERIAYLIQEKGIKPEEILATTFTDKAAQEMEDRVEKALDFGYYDFWISTFHSFCDRVLKNYGLLIGLPTNYKLLDRGAAWILIKKNFDKFHFLKHYRPLGNPTKFIHALLNHFSECKNEGIYPEDYLEYIDSLKKDLNDIEEDERLKEIAEAYHVYQKLLLDNSALDFGDLINYTLKLFEKRKDILEKFRNQFKYILIDEFQDTNWVQYELMQKISSPRNNINVLLDDDQSIFSFCGTSFNNVLRFKKDYPNSKEVVLIENYRSSQNILDLAYNFIQNNNPNRLEYQLNEIKELNAQAKKKGIDLKKFVKINKKLKSNQKKQGMVELLCFESGDEEITGVVNKIWEIKEIDKEAKFSDFAILCRTNDSANNFSRGLERAGIPFQFFSSKGLYTNPLILDFISYFRVVVNLYDSMSFYRILRMSPFNLTPEEVSTITHFADKKGIHLYEAIQSPFLMNKFTSETREKLRKMSELLKKHYELSKDKSVGEVFIHIINDLNYAKHLDKADEDTLKKWEIIYQFYEKAREFEQTQNDSRLISFIEQIQMEIDAGEEGSIKTSLDDKYDAVKVMTVHSAKGLEFKYVFVVSLVRRKFPSDERKSPIEIPEELIKEVLPQGDFHIQEERRLFYVALTRAKRGLFLTWALDYGGKEMKKPSPFLVEANLIDKETLSKQNFSKNSNFCFKKSFNNGFKLESNETNVSGKTVKDFLPDHFSFSQIAAFKNCPLQYKFSHVFKIPARGKPIFTFGKTIHGTLHKFITLAIKDREIEQKDLFGGGSKTKKEKHIPSIEELMDIYDKEWADDWYESEKVRKEFYEKGKKALRLFYENFKDNGLNLAFINDEPALEKNFGLKLNGDYFIGAIDRIDKISEDAVEIIDYKTGIPKKTLGKEEKTQLLIYQLAVEKVFGLNVQRLTYCYIENGTCLSFCAKEGEMAKIEQELKETINRIKRSNFKPSPGWQCNHCDFKDICAHRKF